MSLTPRDPWSSLESLTAARIALGRAGGSLPTAAHLAFQLDHARARDAVHRRLDVDALSRGLAARRVATIGIRSAAADRTTYLQRPDLGRRVHPPDRSLLSTLDTPVDVALVVADGLSALAVERHAPPLVELLVSRVAALGWVLAPVVLVMGGRVAIGDEVGELLRARLSLVLIGERPGLSAPDSLGAYLTWRPRVGRLDAERNCVSNIRPDGLPVPLAAERLIWLMSEAQRRGLTGVALKDEREASLTPGEG